MKFNVECIDLISFYGDCLIPNMCEGVSIIFDVLNRLSPHAPLLSLVSVDDEDAAIKQVKTVLLMTRNVAVSNNIDEMPVFE